MTREVPAVVMVTWNTRSLVLEGVRRLAGAVPIVIVDNASTDGTAEALRAHDPHVRLLANTVNRGYAAAANQGVAATDAAMVLIANADVACTPEAVMRLAEFLGRHPRAALVGPRLHAPNGALQLSWGREPHLVTEAIQRWWWRRLERQSGQGILRHWASIPRRMDWVLGACMMVRRDVWQSLHGLDETYFMYFEEVDFCTRARQAGWDVWYDPTVTVVHQGGASAGQVPDAMALVYRRSQLRYYQRFHGPRAASLLRAYLTARLGWTPSGRQILRGLAESR